MVSGSLCVDSRFSCKVLLVVPAAKAVMYLSSCVRKSGLFVAITALRPLFVFGACLAGLFEEPTFSVGMGGWRFWGAINLALASEYAVQTGWTQICIFGRPFPLTGLWDPEPGINCRIIGFITIFAALVFVASCFAVGIFVI